VVEIRWVVFKLNFSQVTDVAEKNIQEKVADRLTTEPELSL
jgi:hypothetical protein